MKTTVCVIGLGNEARGDDASGLAVVDLLRRKHPRLWTVKTSDPTTLLDVLDRAHHLVVIDSIVSDGPPGRVLVCTPELMQEAGVDGSTHALEVLATLQLYRALHPDRQLDIHLVGITSPPDGPRRFGLSARVAAAVPRAVERVQDIMERSPI